METLLDNFASLIVDTVRESLLILDSDLIVRFANRSFYQTFQVTPEQTLNQPLFSLGNGQWSIPELKTLLEEIIPTSSQVEGFEVTHNFPSIGHRIMLLNARRMRKRAELLDWVLLAIEDITQQKQAALKAEQAIQRSERHFRKLIENSHDAIVLNSADGVIHYASSSTENIRGYRPEEMIGHTFYEVAHPDDAERIRAQFTYLGTQPGGVVSMLGRARHKDGSWRWLEATARNLLDDPDVASVVVNYQDITERKNAEAAQHYLASIVESSHDAIFSITLDGIIQSWNASAERMYGYAAQEIIGQPVSLLIPPDKLDEQQANTERILMGERVTNFETVRVRKDGEHIAVSLTYSPIRDADGRINAISKIGRDITEQKQALEAIRFQAQLLNAVGQAVIATDLAGNVVYWNQAAETLYGWKAAEVMGQKAAILIPGGMSKSAAMKIMKQVKSGKNWTGEYQVQRRDGTAFPVWVTDAPIYDADGKLIGVVGISTDISERKAMEQALAASEQFARSTVDALTAHIAIIDATGEIIAVNQAWRQFAEENPPVSVNVCEGANYLVVCERASSTGDELAAQFAAGIRAVIQGERDEFTLEYPCHSPTEQRWFLGRVTRFKAEGPTHVVIAHENITERVIAHEQTRQLLDLLGERNRNLLILHKIGQQLASAFEKQKIYPILYHEIAQELLQAPHLLLALYDEENQQLRCDFAVVDERELSLSLFPVVPLGSGPNSEAIRTRQPQIVELDLDKPPGEQMSIGDVPRIPKSGLYLPLVSGDRVIGVISIQRYEPDAFQGVDLTFLMTIASQAAVALEKAQLYESLRENASELSALYNATSYLFKSDSLLNLGHQVVQAVIAEFGHIDCGLLVLDHNKTIRRIAREGAYQVAVNTKLELDGPGLVPETLRTGKQVYAPNVSIDSRYVPTNPRTQSELVIPLHTLQGVIGVLDLQSPELDGFSVAQRRILAAFSERVAAALENMLLYEALNQHAAELETRVARRTAEVQRVKDNVEAILNNSSDAILLLAADGRVEQANPAFNQLFRLKDDTVYGQPLSTLTDPMHVDTLQRAVQAVLETHQPNRIELPLVRQTGTVFEADVALAPILSDEKDQTRIICSIRDVSERKQAEAELRQALAKEKELNELKTRFVSMVSHDFRTPLATILSSADLVWHYADRMTEDRKRQHFATIQGQVKHLTNLLEDVLTINRAESGSLPFNPETTNLETFCKTVVEEMQLLAGSRTVHFTASRSTDLPVDTKLMRQALVNLLSNAIKYSPDGSRIDFGLCSGNKKAVLSVKDRGIGIPEADQAHLFEVFHRASNVGTIRGTGLGMVIVKQAVEAHGGTVTVKSQVGIGTTVVIEIPIKEQAK